MGVNKLTDSILLALLLMLVIFGGYAVLTDSLINSIIALSVYSINLTVIFLVLQAVDVAMTEAVIGAGMITSFFIITINKTEEK